MAFSAFEMKAYRCVRIVCRKSGGRLPLQGMAA